ncbi:hypothetical protein [Streptomyces sp. A1547]|uniref:hypothetical protein n=1 Tax=Streptomyces sp. A1547 TaxID=2563105 RepID=UPI00109EB5D5|nr:hypothetical protein [Streptomyces sp. A1547]THA29831.1 hypothetical protein E6W17_38835 [Streptomyces sp. A1547]
MTGGSGPEQDTHRLAVIRQGRYSCQPSPAELQPAYVSVVAYWSPTETRLVLVDSDHPCLTDVIAGSDPVPREEVLTRLRALPPAVSAGAGIGWTARLETETITAPLRCAGHPPTPVPASAQWSSPGVPLTVTVQAGDDSGDSWTVEYHCSAGGREGKGPSTPADAAAELLQLLTVVARTSPAPSAIVDQLLEGQPLGVVTVRGESGNVVRHLGSGMPRSAPTFVRTDDSAAFIWDRRPVGGIMHVVDAGAPVLGSVHRRLDDGTPVLTVGALLAAGHCLPTPSALAGDDSAVVAVTDDEHGWSPVPGASVTRTGSGWKVVVRAVRESEPSRGEVRRLALCDRGQMLVYEAAPRADVLDAVVRLSHVTAGLKGQAVTLLDGQASGMAAAVAATRQRKPGSAAAAAVTRMRAVAWLGPGRKPVDRDSVDRVVDSVLRVRSDAALLPSLEAALSRVGVADIEERRYGHQVVALLVMERELEKRFTRPRTADAGVFADALTTYLLALNQASPETAPWAWQRIIRYTREYLMGRRLRQTRSPSITSVPGSARTLWEELAQRMPWIRWLAEPSLDPKGGIALSPAGLVDLLVLLRPRQTPVVSDQRRHSPDTGVRIQTLSGRFTRLYQIADPALTPPLLDSLAKALSPLLHDPALSGRMVQALTLPPKVRAAVEERVAAEIKDETAAEHLLAVRVDDHESPKALLVNLSPHTGLYLHLDGEPTRLATCAIEQEGAFNYCTSPVPISPDSRALLGSHQVSLDAAPVPLATGTNVTLPALPADLFRGREQQLARLSRITGGSGPRAGSLVFGTRRAGKSSLAYQAGQDPRLRGQLWIDMSNTRKKVHDFAEWNRAICRVLAVQARRHLRITLDTEGTDLVELLTDLDQACDGGAPVAVVLDELDVLLLPEQGSDGRRTAGRLGSLVCRNLVLIGTVQRFHRSVHELKTWQSVECPADLSWADGITYFLGPLADRTAGPRVEWLRRAGVTPRHFATEIVPRIGLRPYFWARLRNDLEGHIHDDRTGSRLITGSDLRHHLDRLVSEDPHLNMVIDDGVELDPDERRRRDLFSVEERRILALFAVMPATRKTLPATEALRVGGEAAVNELIDRAYLSYVHGRDQLCTAVPIYHTFLRARATDLLAVTPGAESFREPERRTPANSGRAAGTPPTGEPETEAPPTGTPGLPLDAEAQPNPVGRVTAKAVPERPVESPPARRLDLDEEVRRARTAVVAELERQNTLSLGAAGSLILAAAPEIFATGWARTGSLARFLTRHLQEFLRVSRDGDVYLARPGATVTAEEEPCSPAPFLSAPPPPDGRSGPTPADIEMARAAVHGALTLRGPMPLPAVGVVIRGAVPLIASSRWAGTGKLRNFLTRFLPDFPQVSARKGVTVLRLPTAAGPSVAPSAVEAARAAVHSALTRRGRMPVSNVASVIHRSVPIIHASRWAGTGSPALFLSQHLPEFPQTTGPDGETHVEPPTTTGVDSASPASPDSDTS